MNALLSLFIFIATLKLQYLEINISKYEELVKTETGHDMPSFKQLFQNANYDVNYLDRYKNEKQMRIYHQSNCKLKLSIDSVSYELF